MIERLAPRSLLLVLSLCVALPFCSAEPAVRSTGADDALLSTNAIRVIQPGPLDGQIAAITAYILTNHHYLKKPFDASLSSEFLDRYLETLDPRHFHFT